MIFPPKLNLFYISHGRAKHLWVFWLPELVVDPKGPGLYLLKNERIAFFWDIFSERKKQTDRQRLIQQSFWDLGKFYPCFNPEVIGKFSLAFEKLSWG